jgi:hypothetical protein
LQTKIRKNPPRIITIKSSLINKTVFLSKEK